MDATLTGPVWEAIRAAGIVITYEPEGWEYAIRLRAGEELSGGSYASQEEALEAALMLLVGTASRV